MTRLRAVLAAIGAIAVLLGAGALAPTTSAWSDSVWYHGSIKALITSKADHIAAGTAHTCGISSGKVYCWGEDFNGRLGVVTSGDALTPVGPVAGLLDGKTATAVSAGNASSCAVAAGAVYCWGDNGSNQLGNSPNVNNPSFSLNPIAVRTTAPSALAGRTMRAVSVGNEMACARAADGRVACWGSGVNNQVAGGNGGDPALPVLVPTVAEQPGPTGNPNQLPANTVLLHEDTGWNSSCASSATEAWCWGDQNNGRLGDGSLTPSTVPRKVLLPAGVITAIAAGQSHSCAIVAGQAYCWGSAQAGALGNGVDSSAVFATPVPVSMPGVFGNVTFVDIDAGENTTCARSTTGTLYCWGDNSNGQLGVGGFSNQTVPAPVVTTNVTPAGTTMSGMAFGQFHGCAIASTNRFYCWGNGQNGRLGNSSTATQSIPVQVQPGAIG